MWECQAIPSIRKLPKDRGPKALEALALPSVWNPQRHRKKIMPRSTIRQIVKGHFTGNHDFSPSRKGVSYGGSPWYNPIVQEFPGLNTPNHQWSIGWLSNNHGLWKIKVDRKAHQFMWRLLLQAVDSCCKSQNRRFLKWGIPIPLFCH